jgi:hypothetical protein
MNATIKKALEAVERAMFGATAEEKVAMQLKLIDLRVENRLARLVAALDEPDETEEEGKPER